MLELNAATGRDGFVTKLRIVYKCNKINAYSFLIYLRTAAFLQCKLISIVCALLHMLFLSEWSIVHYSNVASISNKQKHIDRPNNIPNVLKPHFTVNLRDRNRPRTKFTISHTITNTINFKSKTAVIYFRNWFFLSRTKKESILISLCRGIIVAVPGFPVSGFPQETGCVMWVRFDSSEFVCLNFANEFIPYCFKR